MLKISLFTKKAKAAEPVFADESYFLTTHLKNNRTYAIHKNDEQRFFTATADDLFVCFRLREAKLNLLVPFYYSRAELEYNEALDSATIPHLFS